MSLSTDAQIGFVKETGWGVAGTPIKFPELVDEDLAKNPTFSNGANVGRAGRRVAIRGRRRLTKQEPGGSFTTEILTKSLGALFEAALGGTPTSTAVPSATGAFQQLFKLATTDPMPSYTIQKGIPLVGGGASQPQTYSGMVCNGFELQLPNAGDGTIKWNFLGKLVSTVTALAAASYPTGMDRLSFIDATILSGTITPPTTTALASGGTALANVTDLNLTLNNNLDGGGFTFGAGGGRGRAPALGTREITGQLTAEYTSNLLRDAFDNQTSLSLLITLARTDLVIAGAAVPTLQILVPDIALEGEFPKYNGGAPAVQSVSFTGFDNTVAADPIVVAIVTAETAV